MLNEKSVTIKKETLDVTKKKQVLSKKEKAFPTKLQSFIANLEPSNLPSLFFNIKKFLMQQLMIIKY